MTKTLFIVGLALLIVGFIAGNNHIVTNETLSGILVWGVWIGPVLIIVSLLSFVVKKKETN